MGAGAVTEPIAPPPPPPRLRAPALTCTSTAASSSMVEAGVDACPR